MHYLSLLDLTTWVEIAATLGAAAPPGLPREGSVFVVAVEGQGRVSQAREQGSHSA